MPKIRRLKGDKGTTVFGKYLSIHEFIKLKLIKDKYFSQLVESVLDDTK